MELLANFLNFWRNSPSTQPTNRWSHQWLFISLKDWRSTVENHKDFNFVHHSSHFSPKQFWGHFDKYIFENEHLWTLNICESWGFLSFSSVHWATIISAIEVWRYELYGMQMSGRDICVWWTISVHKKNIHGGPYVLPSYYHLDAGGGAAAAAAACWAAASWAAAAAPCGNHCNCLSRFAV